MNDDEAANEQSAPGPGTTICRQPNQRQQDFFYLAYASLPETEELCRFALLAIEGYDRKHDAAVVRRPVPIYPSHHGLHGVSHPG